MIDLLIKLIEKIIDLARERKKRHQGIFNEFYREIFDNLSQVHSNYLVSLNGIKDNVRKEQLPSDLRASIMSKRAEMKGARDHIESSMTIISEQINTGSFEQLEVAFLTEIDTYMRSYFNGRTSFTGIASLLDEMSLELASSSFSESGEYRRRFHERTFREHMLDELERTERWLESQFSDICVIYNTLRAAVFHEG